MDAASVATIGGMRKGGFSGALGNPSCGGSRGIDVCQRFLLAHSVPAAWGEPARPGFPPEGETGKGEFRLPCCRRQFALASCEYRPRRCLIVCSLFFHVSLHSDHQTYRSIRSFRFPEVLLAPPTPLPCFYPHSKWAALGPVQVGVRSHAQVHPTVTDLGCWGAAICLAISGGS